MSGSTAHLLEHRARLLVSLRPPLTRRRAGGWPASCSLSTARPKTSTRPWPNASAAICMRGSSSRWSLHGFGPNLGADPGWLPAGTWHPSPPRPTGVLRRICACAKGFAPHQREPAPPKTLRSPTSAGVLHGRAVQHPRQPGSPGSSMTASELERLIHSQARPPPRRRPLALLRDRREFSPHMPTAVRDGL